MHARSTKLYFAYAALLVLPFIAGYLTLTPQAKSVEIRLREPLPAISIISENEYSSQRTLQEVLRTFGNGCVYLTVISPSCPVCGRMRGNWGEKRTQWEAETGASAQLVWMTTSSLAEGKAFVGKSEARSIPLLAMSDAMSGSLALGLSGTPTSFLLDDEGRLLKVVLGDVFPYDTATSQQCKQGT